MVSEPTSPETGIEEPPTTPVQPRWMTNTVALSGIIGLAVMIYLVFGA